MMSKTINRWEQIEDNPSIAYKNFFEAEKSFLVKYIPKDSIVLEVGCGSGRITKLLSKITKKVVGIDNDKKAIDKCKNELKNLKNIEISFQDIEKTDFDDNSFDVIILFFIFENLGDTKLKVLIECKRLLRNNGLLILSCYNENALNERLKMYNKIEQKSFKVTDKGKVIFYDNVVSEQFGEADIKKILIDAGFKILNMEKGDVFYLIRVKK